VRRKFRALQSEEALNTDDELTIDLTKDEVSRQRFRFDVNPYPELGPRWGQGIGLYIKLCKIKHNGVAVREPLRHLLFDVLGISKFKSSKALREAFTYLTTMAKKDSNDNPFGIPRVFLINLDLLGGFVPNMRDDDYPEFEKTVRNWVSKKRV